MKVKHFVIMVFLAVILLIVVRLHTIKQLQVTFPDDKMISSDGKGPYVDGYSDIFFDHLQDTSFSMHGYISSRSVSVRFEDIAWKDGNLTDIPPRFPSRNCRIDLSFYLGNSSMHDMEVGGRLEPTSIYIGFLDTESYQYVTIMERDTYNAEYSFLPLILYNRGHVYLVREGEDDWVLDVDAWFLNTDPTSQMGLPKYYAYLNFTMKIEYRNPYF